MAVKSNLPLISSVITQTSEGSNDAGGSSAPIAKSPTSIDNPDILNIPEQTPVFLNTTTPVKDANKLNSKPYSVSYPPTTSGKNKTYIDYKLDFKSQEEAQDLQDISDIRTKLHNSLNIYDSNNAQKTFTRYTTAYNRFKIPTVNDAFQKGFAHVFFTRPDCNFLTPDGNKLNDTFKNDPEVNYVWKNSPDVVKQLVLNNGQNHQFMLSLSNKVASFSLSDEYINTETYGKTFKGWQVAYGRNNIESKTVNDLAISFNDDRTLHIYLLHKLWTNYISDVYIGKKSPNPEYIRKRMLDYTSACYYILTAEDGETIVFWSKYYGVFPTTVPSNQFAYAHGNIITQDNAKLDTTYKYSFKEDMNIGTIAEFNLNARVSADDSLNYVPTYSADLGHAGPTWVGKPYIELIENNGPRKKYVDCPYTFKLRFAPESKK